MASHAYSSASKSEITVSITPVIEREFERRSVFTELRLENACRIVNGATGWHRVSLERAREILADAEAQNQKRGLPRGVPVAYGSLVRQIADSLKYEARRGLIEDPGIVEVKRRQAAASASLTVGNRVIYFRDGDEYGQEATIAGDYQMYSVYDDAGPYINRDDRRIAYQYGYIIKIKGSDQTFFVRAYQLTRDDCKPSHLRLVA